MCEHMVLFRRKYMNIKYDILTKNLTKKIMYGYNLKDVASLQ